MNFLAHIYLSGENDLIKFGNFIGDWVKGKQYENYPEDIKKGILLHRQIDTFTDKHHLVRQCNARFRPAYGKYAGIAVDILFDHFLSKNRQQYSRQNLADFVADFHQILKSNINYMPAKGKRFMLPFIRKKRLLCYRDLDCLRDVFVKMAIFTSLPDKSAEAMRIISSDYQLFEQDFQVFFEDIRQFSGRLISS